MKKVLYLTNIEVPYRVRFFNDLAAYCDLTVLFERKHSANRDKTWTESVERRYKIKYLSGIKIGNENVFSLGVLRHILSDYDAVIVGCYNSPVGMLAILAMRLLFRKYLLNLDGEPFISGGGMKTRIKKFFLRGAHKYLCAGEKSAQSLSCIVPRERIYVYHFSSLSDEEIALHRKDAVDIQRDGHVLVVGQYFDYKGMDVALEAARLDFEREYLFVGMGKRTELFEEEQNTQEVKNVRLIPFLQKKELESEYKSCAALLLPSRQECWGLVVNEAASFGTPIISTWGSGAAVEFISDGYGQYLAQASDARSLYECIGRYFESDKKNAYSEYLLDRSAEYSIEKNVEAHLEALGIQKEEQ